MGGSEDGPGNRLLAALCTALPMTLMSLASCVSYAHLMESNKRPISVALLSSSSFFSAGMASWSHNMCSHCPFLMTCPDITFSLFLQAGLSHVHSPARAMLSIHLSGVLLGGVFWLLGFFRIMAALRYLPYPVVAGFLAMIGAAVTKAAFNLLLVGPTTCRLVSIPVAMFFGMTVLILKTRGTRTSVSAPALIMLLLGGFYGTVWLTGKSQADLAQEGWVSPPSGQSEPLEIFTLLYESFLNFRNVESFHGLLTEIWSITPGLETLLLLVVPSIMRALTIIAIESAYADEPYSVDQEMQWLGLATLAGAAVGGVPMNATSAMTDLTKEGVRGDRVAAKRTAQIVSLLHLCMWGSGFPLVDYLPRFLLAGLLMQMGGGMLWDWGWQVTGRVQWSGMVVIWAMVATSLLSDTFKGVLLGVVLALISLIMRFSKLEVLKYHVSGVHFRSGQLYSQTQRAVLKKYGDTTEIVGLTGFVFEGVAISLAVYLKQTLRTATELERLIVDCASCQGINDSAMSHLAKVAQDCQEKHIQLIFCSLSPFDEALVRSWALDAHGCRIMGSITEALSTAERETLKEVEPVKPTQRQSDEKVMMRALAKWLGEATAQELRGHGFFHEVGMNQEISTQDLVMEKLFIAIPGFSDVQMEVQTGTQNRPAMLLRTCSGAVCPAEALIGSHCRGNWVAAGRSVGLLIHDVKLLKEQPKVLAALQSAALHQQLLQSDQLSAMYTLSKGGGWRGVTLDATTNLRTSRALGDFGPRRRKSYSKRASFLRASSGQQDPLSQLELDTGVSSKSLRERHASSDADIAVAAVLDFQRFNSISCTPSLDLDMEAAQEAESTNVMLNRYSVSANLNQLRSVGTLGDLDFESEFADLDSPEEKEAIIEIGDAPK